MSFITPSSMIATTANGATWGQGFCPRAKRVTTDHLVIHCSATVTGRNDVDDIVEFHMLRRRWKSCGYHAVVDTDGHVYYTLDPDCIGAHVGDVVPEPGQPLGWNGRCLGICWLGGLDENGRIALNITPLQAASLKQVAADALAAYPTIKNTRFIRGHNEMIGVFGSTYDDPSTPQNEGAKACPIIDMPSFRYDVMTIRKQRLDAHPVISDSVLNPIEPGEDRRRDYSFFQWVTNGFSLGN